MTTYTGQVKLFRHDFGFIALDPGQPRPAGVDRDVFVHIAALMRSGIDFVQQGDRVRFEIGPGKRPGQFEAKNITLVEVDEAA